MTRCPDLKGTHLHALVYVYGSAKRLLCVVCIFSTIFVRQHACFWSELAFINMDFIVRLLGGGFVLFLPAVGARTAVYHHASWFTAVCYQIKTTPGPSLSVGSFARAFLLGKL